MKSVINAGFVSIAPTVRWLSGAQFINGWGIMSDPKYINMGTPFDRLVEECGELLQAASKINRFGYYNRHPDGGPTNLEKLCAEWMDLKSAFSNYLDDVLHQAGYQAVFDDIKPEK